jgi:glycosyltransferase involved in cell wall biosynthesis
LNQSYNNIELVIVDDDSPENIYDIVSKYDDPRIKYFKNEVNIGGTDLVAQWNYSIFYAKGDYLVLAADDDIYHENFTSNCIALIKKYPEVDLIRSRVSLVNDRGDLIEIDGILPEKCSQIEYVYSWAKGIPLVCIGNYVFRTSTLQKEKFDKLPFAFGTDTISTIKLARNGVANTSEMLFDFRISEIHLSSDKTKYEYKIEAITSLYKMINSINYKKPEDEVDDFCLSRIQWDSLYQKCVYDYYNVAVKHLPLNKIGMIESCRLLSRKDKLFMYFRFILDKILK